MKLEELKGSERELEESQILIFLPMESNG